MRKQASNLEITAIVNVYEEAENLARCLRSIEDTVDRIVVADGAYADYPHDCAISTDGTRNVAHEKADVFITCQPHKPWLRERQKRNALLGAVPMGTWVLRIDADEELKEFDFDPQDDEIFAGNFRHYEDEDTMRIERNHVCFFKRTADLHYKGKDALYKGDTSVSNVGFRVEDGIVVDHHPYRRSEERLQGRREYRERVDQHYEDFD